MGHYRRRSQSMSSFTPCARTGTTSPHTQRVENVRASLLFIADPVSELNDFDRSTLAGPTLGKLHHARLVLLRLLPHLTAATDVERP